MITYYCQDCEKLIMSVYRAVTWAEDLKLKGLAKRLHATDSPECDVWPL